MKKNNEKYKFPIELKGELVLPELEIPDPFSKITIKKKIDLRAKEIEKIKNNKRCHRSNRLI